MDLDNQSTDDFAFYKILIKGIGHPIGGIMALEARFQDLGGDIADTNGYQVDVYDLSGTSLIDTRTTFMTLARFNVGNTGDMHYFCSFDLTLGSSASAQNMLNGSFNITDVAGTPNLSGNIRCSLTNNVTISTRITGLGFRMTGVDGAQNREIFCRIFRLL